MARWFSVCAAVTVLVAFGVAGGTASAATDLCPDTPRGAKAVFKGCAPLDIVRRPRVITASTERAAAAALRDMPPLQSTARTALTRSYSRLLQATTQMSRGNVCPAARSYDQVLASLRAAHAAAQRGLPAQRAAVARRYPPGHGGDISEGQFQGIGLELGVVGLQRTVAELKAARLGFTAPCRNLSPRPLDFRGQLGRVDDAAGLLRAPRRTIGLTGQLDEAILTGAFGRVRGIQFNDGTSLATTISASAGRVRDRKVAAVIPREAPPACAEPRIVPFARAGGKGNPRQHIEAYQQGGDLWLEEGMKLATKQTCPTLEQGSAMGRTVTSYVLRFALTYKRRATLLNVLTGGGGTGKLIASDVSEEETGVALPDDIATGSTSGRATLRVTEFARTCATRDSLHIGPEGERVWVETSVAPCGFKVRRSRTYGAWIRPAGYYASVTYSATQFDLETRPKGTCRVAHVNGGTSHSSLQNAADVAFEAEAWPASGDDSSCTSTRPAVSTIGANQPFAIYVDDLVPPGLDPDVTLANYGVRNMVGLAWPRVTGTRNGHRFTYSATPPHRLVRDRLTSCAEGTDYWEAPVPDTFHRAPFQANSTTWLVLQGNEDDPAHFNSDNSLRSDRYHAANQRYEWDIINDANGDGKWDFDHPIHASRAGYVILLDRDERGNLRSGNDEYTDKPLPGGRYTGVGNYVWIHHADGTNTTYNHLRHNTVPAGLKVGDWVRRGQLIGKNGNTGDSSGPHLHWGAFTVPASWNPFFPVSGIRKVPLRVQDTAHQDGCWIPREMEFFRSNNTEVTTAPFFVNDLADPDFAGL